MADAVADGPEEKPAKSLKLPLVVGLVLAIAGGGSGYLAVSSGLLPVGGPEQTAGDTQGTATEEHSPHDQRINSEPKPLPDIAYVPLEPIVVSLLRPSNVEHLRFRAQLEVEARYQADVEKILPRVTDVLNEYLRALDVKYFEDPAVLIRLRAQMLRRIQIVTGPGRVRDLLIMDFVLN